MRKIRNDANGGEMTMLMTIIIFSAVKEGTGKVEYPIIPQIGARVEGWDRELDSLFFRSPPNPDTGPALSNPKLRNVISRTHKKEKYMQKDAEVRPSPPAH